MLARRAQRRTELRVTASSLATVSNAGRVRLSAHICVLGARAGSLAVCPDLYHLFPTAECK